MERRIGTTRSEEEEAHARAMELLNQAGIPYVVGGAFAVRAYTGIWRDTKDLDLFLLRRDIQKTLSLLGTAGYRVELTDPDWLAKAFHGDYFIDLIFSSYNRAVPVDEEWIRHGQKKTILGVPTRVTSPEEMIWSKIYVQDRERYDGADIAHLIRARGKSLDWDRLIDRMGEHWRLLMAQILTFQFIYPDDRENVPPKVVERLLGRAMDEQKNPPPVARHLCRGPLLSRCAYTIDVEAWGYRDAREVETKPPGEPV